MFDQYPTIDVLAQCQARSLSVLGKFRHTTSGPQLVQSLIRPFAQVINDDQAQIEQLLACLDEDRDVLWIMEVIGYGLRLPLSDQEQYEAVRDCVNIYHEWFQALCPQDSAGKFIPRPIREDPNLYCQKIVGHFYNIFLTRTPASASENISLINNKQAVFCHRILRLIIKIAANKNNVINAETWESLLVFLLAINKELLQGPVNGDLIGTQIAERVINTLFEAWLLACSTCFPSFSHWKTLQSVCVSLRHRPSLIIQWNRVNICLTNALVRTLYDGESKLELHSLSHFTSYNSFVSMLSPEALRQCWFRFLHIIGNPIELCFPELIFRNREEKLANQTLLPFIFHKAIKGICILVDIFLGVPNIILEEFNSEMPKFIANSASPSPLSPPSNAQDMQDKRKSNFSLLGPKGSAEKNVSKASISRPKNSPEQSYELPTLILPQLFANLFQQNRVKSTSILDIFGKWLFQASLISSTNIPMFNLLVSEQLPDKEISYSLDNFETGQAEAIGALCRIFCFKRIDEDISLILSTPSHGDSHKVKNYMTSYYLALKLGLSCVDSGIRNQLLSSILVNSVWFFEVDLPGSKILIPHFLKAIEIFITRRDKRSDDNDVVIRRACIKILTSLLAYPSHFRDLPIKDTLSEVPSHTFLSLYPKLIILLIHGLQNENDSHNVQLIFSALLFIVEDIIKNDHIFSLEGEAEYEEILGSFHTYFKFDSYTANKAEKGDIPSNLFLVIVTFVSEILCKSSVTDSTDYNIPLTALEILSSFGRMTHSVRENILCGEKCKIAIRQIFDFIENQCYRRPKFHSRDMHSTIVAAYQCLSVWFHEHDHLLHDHELIVSLFELIELGISGSKSRKDVSKADKELKPTSMRVKEAAESLLMTLMERVNPSRNFAESSIGLNDLNEQKIINLLFGANNAQIGPKRDVKGHFRFFVVDNNMIVSILEDCSNDEETVCILRTPHGKHCWILKYQHITKRQLCGSATDGPNFKSIPKSESLARSFTFNYFPQFYDQICTTKFDNSVLNVTDYVQTTPEIKQEFDEMLNLIDKIEGNLRMEKVKLNISSFKKELQEPQASKQFDVSRLIFSQFKMFNSNLYEIDNENKTLMSLNATDAQFYDQIERLDLISTKNNDVVFLFYIPSSFKTESDIFAANSSQFQSNAAYRDFVLSLGSMVYQNPLGFYWSDIQHELIFVSPTRMPGTNEENPSAMINLIKEDNEQLRSLLFDKDGPPEVADNENAYQFFRANTGCDIKLVVLYLENYNDLDRLPLNPTETTIDFEVLKERLYVIAIAPQKNGLYKVVSHFLGNLPSIPLINERMLLSKYLISTYIRITALNLMRRHRMTNEGIHMPHVKRRNKMQEIIGKYKVVHEKEELISNLFKNGCPQPTPPTHQTTPPQQQLQQHHQQQQPTHKTVIVNKPQV